MSVKQLARQANQRDRQTAKEEHTLKKNHKPGVTNKATPSRQDTNFKNTRTEVGMQTNKTIAPKPNNSGSRAAAPKKKTSFFSSSSSKSPKASGGGSAKFCSGCGTARGAGAFCSSCGQKF